jgi:hypothetical protein
MTESNIFGTCKFQIWAAFHPRIRGDLYFVMDDSWDVSFASQNCGADVLNPERFPSFAASARR